MSEQPHRNWDALLRSRGSGPVKEPEQEDPAVAKPHAVEEDLALLAEAQEKREMPVQPAAGMAQARADRPSGSKHFPTAPVIAGLAVLLLAGIAAFVFRDQWLGHSEAQPAAAAPVPAVIVQPAPQTPPAPVEVTSEPAEVVKPPKRTVEDEKPAAAPNSRAKETETQAESRKFVPPPSNASNRSAEIRKDATILEPPPSAATGSINAPHVELPRSVGQLPEPPAPVKETPAPQRVRIGGTVKNGRLLKSVQPIYPEMAKAMHLQGKVKLAATVGPDGRVKSVKLISGNPTFARAAEAAVKQWVYEPSLLDGEPVQVVNEVELDFNLRR